MLKRKCKKYEISLRWEKNDADLAKYIPGLMDLAIQGMLDDIDTH